MRNIYRALQFVLLIVAFIFTTSNSEAQCCQAHLSMHDSYGDGWNGGNLNVYVNNILQGNYAAANYASTISIPFCTGDIIKLEYFAGAYENENSYHLYDTSWNLLFSAGPNPAAGISYNSTATCSASSLSGSHPCNAIPIDTGQCLYSNNNGLSGSGLNPGCANFQGADRWFKTMVPPSGNIGFETDSGTINDTGLAIWTDSICSNIHYLACDDDAGNGYFSRLNIFDLVPGQTVYIQVFGYGTAVGTFKLCVYDLGLVSLDSSNLPIVLINTLNQTIPYGNKIPAKLDIKYNGPGSITYLTDSSNIYTGDMGINIRGASSSGYPQPPYAIETRTTTGSKNNVPLFGMPKEHDWALLSNYNDRSLIRNSLAFKLFNEMGGGYAPRTQFCEVLIDSSYKGIYLFVEKIKRDSGRVPIAKLKPIDSTGDALTGGYILQQNLWNSSNSFQSNYSPIDHPGFDIHFLYDYPNPDSITAVQKAYIASYVDTLETALYSNNFTDTAVGYRKYLGVKSFIDYFLVNELARNADGFKKSVFFHKDKNSNGGKLKAGPVWDFDWAWKNLYGCSLYENTDGSGWAHHNNDCPTDNYSCGYYIRLLMDSSFRNELRCTYEDYRTTIFDTTYLFNYIDSIGVLMQTAQARHFARWPILGVSGPAPEISAIATTYAAELDTLKHWIKIRLQWLDINMPGLCNQVPVASANLIIKEGLQAYPNPSTGLFHFVGEIKKENTLFEIYDAVGKRMMKNNLSSGRVSFTYTLPSGIYYYQVRSGGKLLQYDKLVVY
jgi:CotH kinase protein/Secretion system C-terminal sorting domain